MDTEKIPSRVMTPGFLLMVVGAVLTYASGAVLRLLPKTWQKHGENAVRVVGCVLVLLGAILLFL